MSGTRAAERTGVCEISTGDAVRPAARAEALASRLERGARALAAFAAGLTPEEWRTRLPKDGRPVGVVVHHVASVYPVEIALAERLAAGAPVEGVTMDDVRAMNAQHAVAHGGVTTAEALALLDANSTAAAAAIRALDDTALDRAAAASLYDGAPVTCQFMLEDHAVRHSYHHLAAIARALGRPSPLATVLAVVGALLGGAPAASAQASLVDTVRAATAELQTPEAATASGWVPATGCVSGPQSGAMGVHYIDGAALFDGDLNPEHPEALIFETRGGRTALVGVEFIVVASQWHAKHGAAPPIVAGQQMHLVGAPNRYGLDAFYELHVWAWKDNPNGTFADWHASVTCDGGHGGHEGR